MPVDYEKRNKGQTVMVRWRLIVKGVVQGVGFRPYVYRLAVQHGLTGFVGNDTSGVFIEVQGGSAEVEAFAAGLSAAPPPLARIDSIDRSERPPVAEERFTIVPSVTAVGRSSSVPADVATCSDCLRELFDPSDRRFRYPFVNCTYCGPRFTIIRDLPYDRPATTMAAFRMCRECEREYHDPSDRRFHAQPIACPACGPTVWLEASGCRRAEREDAIGAAIELLAAGAIVAIKGIGGFHLACDATNPKAVSELRQRKRRHHKPFAVMVRDVTQARQIAMVGDDAAEVLTGPERPIVMLDRTEPSLLADGVAPGLRSVGLMLPYSPIHHLLLTGGPLVMTSGNRADEPIARDNTEARGRLADIADAFLMHDRDIYVPCDDSVVRVFSGHEYPIRRSRGYAPLPIKLPVTGRALLAVGGELKATLCVTVGDHAYLSQHIGDVESPDTLAALDRTADHLLSLFRVSPEAVACDLHPGYLSAEWAARFAVRHGVPLVRVQHHKAHVASLLIDTGWTGGPVLVACFDGTGYGSDGAIWGGEFFLASGPKIERVGHLKYIPLPGGDAAIRKPYRVALAHLWAAGLPWAEDLPCTQACTPAERHLLRQQLDRNWNCVPTSSLGRLFDAIASLAGVRQEVSYEGQAAMELEAMAVTSSRVSPYPFSVSKSASLVLDPAPTLSAVVADAQAGVDLIPARFHATVAEMILTVVRQCDARTVGLTGGVFQNTLLLSIITDRLHTNGVHTLIHRQLPTNDGGLSVGQAAIVSGIFAE